MYKAGNITFALILLWLLKKKYFIKIDSGFIHIFLTEYIFNITSSEGKYLERNIK